ncbi:hypothetical protein ACXZ74_01780 [Streptococcus agalactiae]
MIVKPSKNSIQTVIGKFSETHPQARKSMGARSLNHETKSTDKRMDKLPPKCRVCLVKPSPIWTIIYTNYCWRWAKRRHPKKGQWWVSTKYWHQKRQSKLGIRFRR